MSEDSKREWIHSTIVIVFIISSIISFKLFQVTIIGFGKLLLISIPLGIIVFALLYKKIKESESLFDFIHILTLFFTIYIVGAVVTSLFLGSNYYFADANAKEYKLKVRYSHSNYSKTGKAYDSVIATYEGIDHAFKTPYETYKEFKDSPFYIQATLRNGYWGYPVIDNWKFVAE